MELGLVLQHVLSVIMGVGAPIIALLIVAVEVGKWHEAQPEVPDEVFRERKDH